MKQSGLMWIRDDDEFIGRYFEPTGDRFEIEHLDQALTLVTKRRCALDVGAHYGSWARHLARSFERVIAFEPVSTTFECLRRNVEGFENIDARNEAVGEQPGFVTVSIGKMYQHPGMETVIAGEGETAMIRIDDLALDQLDFLKIDVEGYELSVLKGAEQTLIRHKPVVIFEENIRGPLEHGVDNGRCAAYLESLGARLISVANKDMIFAWRAFDDVRARFLSQYVGSAIESVEADLGLPIRGFVGRSATDDVSEFKVVGGELPTAARSPFLIVSFYTAGNGYDIHAARLRASLDRLGLAHSIEEVDDQTSWEAVCAIKSRFVLRKWREADVPIVWLDADAIVEQTPALFGAIDADFAAHKWTWENGRESFGYELGSGTLYFGQTELAGKLLEQWACRCAADPDTWDQKHLDSAWCDISAAYPLRTVWLPRSYLQIDGGLEISPPAIRHMQASRTEKPRRAQPASPQFLLSEVGIEDRRRSRLWRTSEQAFWILEGVDHIIPNAGHDFPEGFDVQAVLERCLGTDASVLEFGCGVGRIAALFDHTRYLGVDINPTAVSEARRRHPQHHIRIWDFGRILPATDALLLYTVLLHVSDDALKPLLAEICKGCDHVLIVELMDRRWRRDGHPPVFNREPEDYILGMKDLNFEILLYEKHQYARYDQQPWNIGHDSRMTFLKFGRKMSI